MSERGNLVAMSAPTRRQIVVGAAAVLGSLAAGGVLFGRTPQKMEEAQSIGVEGLLTYLHQEIDIKASPQRIYEALLDSKQFSTFTGLEADINREAGGAISMFGGLILGRNIELVPNQRIVQAWRPTNWDAGMYSVAKFELKQQGAQTKVILDHTGFPEGNFRHLDSGWHGHYWEPLSKFLA